MPDKFDLELWRSIPQTQVWEQIVFEIDRRIRNEMESLTMCAPQDLTKIQERIRALNELKQMPEQVVNREEGQVPS